MNRVNGSVSYLVRMNCWLALSDTGPRLHLGLKVSLYADGWQLATCHILSEMWMKSFQSWIRYVWHVKVDGNLCLRATIHTETLFRIHQCIWHLVFSHV